MKIAIIGSGISGLTAAHLLHKQHDITILEANDYIGGHTHTHQIEVDKKKWLIDSGFIVYNENTYPNFIKLLQKLKVDTQKTSMGFSVKAPGQKPRVLWRLAKLFICPTPQPISRPSFLMMLKDIIRV